MLRRTWVRHLPADDPVYTAGWKPYEPEPLRAPYFYVTRHKRDLDTLPPNVVNLRRCWFGIRDRKPGEKSRPNVVRFPTGWQIG